VTLYKLMLQKKNVTDLKTKVMPGLIWDILRYHIFKIWNLLWGPYSKCKKSYFCVFVRPQYLTWILLAYANFARMLRNERSTISWYCLFNRNLTSCSLDEQTSFSGNQKIILNWFEEIFENMDLSKRWILNFEKEFCVKMFLYTSPHISRPAKH
jgi:hypothetical protein